MEFRIGEGGSYEMSVKEWLDFAKTASLTSARERARSMGITIIWDCELPKTPEGYYHIENGIEYATARSLAVAPFADILWMETKTANLADAKIFQEAIHARFPKQMLAYNLSPSFNWDTTGMSDEEMKTFPRELGKLGYVFNFITYGGHQVDGMAAEEFATALRDDGMLALARLQRKLRLVESPYRTPQSLVGGPRLDGALMASTGRSAATRAMGKGSTQFQHLVQTEVPRSLLEGWLQTWADFYELGKTLSVSLQPHTAGSDLLELVLDDGQGNKLANVIFADIKDRKERSILSIRDQNTFAQELRKKRLMTLIHVFLIHRYKAGSVHYVSPTEDNTYQAQKMMEQGLYEAVHDEVGHIIVTDVSQARVAELLAEDGDALIGLIERRDKRAS
jgi:isocitrate lyase